MSTNINYKLEYYELLEILQNERHATHSLTDEYNSMQDEKNRLNATQTKLKSELKMWISNFKHMLKYNAQLVETIDAQNERIKKSFWRKD